MHTIPEVKKWFYDRNPKSLMRQDDGLYFREDCVLQALLDVLQVTDKEV